MVRNHRLIWSTHYGEIPKDDKGVSYHVHHVDGDRYNNCIENLIAISQLDHFWIHFNQGDYRASFMLMMKLKRQIPLHIREKVREFIKRIPIVKFEDPRFPDFPYSSSEKYEEEYDLAYKARQRYKKSKYHIDRMFPKLTSCQVGVCKRCDKSNRINKPLLELMTPKYRY